MSPGDRSGGGGTMIHAVERPFRVAWGRLLLGYRLRRQLPEPVAELLGRLARAGIPVWLVGGCVRDLLLGRQPRDWDLVAAADSHTIRAAVDRGRTARHGTVIVPLGPGQAVEITAMLGSDLSADLGRRDFTTGAMALSLSGRFHDPCGGLRDLARGMVRATGNPGARLDEDPVRLLRAVRLTAELQGQLEPATRAAIPLRAERLSTVAVERRRDELTKLLLSPWPAWGLEELRRLGLLPYLLPELLETVGVTQNRYHAFTVWEHLLLTTASVPPVLHLRLAALLHDAAKPRSLSVDDRGERHFYNHEVLGAELAETMLERLRIGAETRSRVIHLVCHHMDLHLDLAMSDRAILRMVRRIGRENLSDLVALRRADYLASGTKPGDFPAGTLFLLERIRALEGEAQAFGLPDLAVDGHDVMRALGVAPGPEVGQMLRRLLADVQDGRIANDRDTLLAWVKSSGDPAG